MDPIVFIEFTDGIERPGWQFHGRQYVIDHDGQPVYGVWYIDRDETPAPIIVQAGPES